MKGLNQQQRQGEPYTCPFIRVPPTPRPSLLPLPHSVLILSPALLLLPPYPRLLSIGWLRQWSA